MSITIPLDSIFSYASQVVQWLAPVIAVSAGLGLGFALVRKVAEMFRSAL